MKTENIDQCTCGANLRDTMTERGAATVVHENSFEFILIHCSTCGTLWISKQYHLAAHELREVALGA
ncbi:MAG: hypothetical protein ACLFP4_04590 [Spirochaetales bacterium]